MNVLGGRIWHDYLVKNSPDPIYYNGSTIPSTVIALADEGVARRADLVAGLAPDALVLSAPGLNLPHTEAEVRQVDFKAMGIKLSHWALASLAILTKMRRVISADMLNDSLNIRFRGDTLKTVKKMLEQVDL